jgi:adenosylcobyric acid synthase
MIHGLFGNQTLRDNLIDWLRKRKGMQEQPIAASVNALSDYDRLADVVRANLDWSLLAKNAGLGSVIRTLEASPQ